MKDEVSQYYSIHSVDNLWDLPHTKELLTMDVFQGMEQ